MENTRFSVIVPVYNVERYLRECIDSILSQAYQNFEIILVDDGSADTSGTICDAYAARDPRVTVIHKENEGLISARRAGLKTATGDYVCFVDSDDTIHPALLADACRVIEDRHADVVTYKWTRTDLAGSLLEEEKALFPEGPVAKREYFRKLASSADLNSLCKKICRRALFDTDRDYREFYCISHGEDLLQSIPVMERAEKFYYLDRSYYYYRTNPASISHHYRGEHWRSLEVIRPMLLQSMLRLGYDSKEDIDAFYSKYLRGILMTLLQCCRSDTCPVQQFREIYEMPNVQKAREYIHLARVREQIGLRLFFGKKWKTFYNMSKLYWRCR